MPNRTTTDDLVDEVEPANRRRVLIVAASRHGATIEIAGVLAQELVGQGMTVIVAAPDDVPDPVTFDAVVIGSAVYFGRWLKSARRFMRRHVEELACTKVWLFSSGPLNDEHGAGVDADHLKWLTRSVGAVDHREFGGRMDEVRDWGRHIGSVLVPS